MTKKIKITTQVGKHYVWIVSLKHKQYEVASDAGIGSSTIVDSLEKAFEEHNAMVTALVWMRG